MTLRHPCVALCSNKEGKVKEENYKRGGGKSERKKMEKGDYRKAEEECCA